MKSIMGVAEQAQCILSQCASLIEAVPDDIFSRDSECVRGGTIGKHLRHTLDHYRALIDGYERAESVDYDRRQRNVPIESDRGAALDAVSELRRRVAALGEEGLRAPVRIRIMLAGDGAEAELDSTVGRELAFASHHAIHHNAMIKTIAAEFGVDTPDEFGVAPSTLNFLGQS